jgi:hypothetical protein
MIEVSTLAFVSHLRAVPLDDQSPTAGQVAGKLRFRGNFRSFLQGAAGLNKLVEFVASSKATRAAHTGSAATTNQF